MKKLRVTFTFGMPDESLSLEEDVFNNLVAEAMAGKPIKVNGKWWLVKELNQNHHSTTMELDAQFDLYLAPNQHPAKMRGFDIETQSKT